MGNSAMEQFYASKGWTCLSSDERAAVHDAVYFGHTKADMMNFAEKHGISMCKSWGKGEMADTIVAGLCHEGYDFEVILSMVSTPSSYIGGDGGE